MALKEAFENNKPFLGWGEGKEKLLKATKINTASQNLNSTNENHVKRNL